MTLAERLAASRKAGGYTQSEIAEKLGVSFQAVSLWERGETTPELDKLVELASLFGVSLDWLIAGRQEERILPEFEELLSDRLFDEQHMYTYVKTYANVREMPQTVKALAFAREQHKGQVRKGRDKVPYIYHPLLMACHALALGLDDDDIVAASLLHDVCEDCGVSPDELPAGDAVKTAVRLLTKEPGYDEEEYYRSISENQIATMVKLLDRCSNVSGMAAGFSRDKLAEYIRETERLVYPLLDRAKTEYPMYSNQLFLIKYHMSSVVEAVKRQ